MNFNDLFLFINVVEFGSFSIAANNLNMSTSTLSRRIQRLENDIGVKLLHRSAKSIALTEHGERIFTDNQAAMREIHEKVKRVSDEITTPNGVLSITAPVGLAQNILNPWLWEFSRLYPDIRLHLALVNRQVKLKEEGIDIAFRIGEQNIQDWVSRSLFKTEFALYASHDTCEQYQHVHHPEQLADVPLIISRSLPIWDLQNDNAEHFRFKPNPVLMVDEINAAADAAACGLGVALLPDYIFSSAMGARLMPLLSQWRGQQRTVQVLYADREQIPKKVRLLVDFVVMKAAQIG